MEAALTQLGKDTGEKKIAILGDMFELGDAAAEEHTAIGNKALELGLAALYLVGNHFYETGLPAVRYRTYEDLAQALAENPPQGPATLLIKASRGMALERLLPLL